jgi:prevent-host-death family protein
MDHLSLTEDIQPLAAFRARVGAFIEMVGKTRRPLVITQHGRSAAVLVNVKEYEAMLEKLELLGDIEQAEKQLAGGAGIPHDSARRQLLGKIRE